MATFKKFEEIESWKTARELTKKVYEVSNKAQFSKDFALRDQIRRAAISVMSNIAEGFDRSGTGEFVQFLASRRVPSQRLDVNCISHWIKPTLTGNNLRP